MVTTVKVNFFFCFMAIICKTLYLHVSVLKSYKHILYGSVYVYVHVHAHACSYWYMQQVKPFELLQVCVLPLGNVHINHVIFMEHHKKTTLTLPVLYFFKFLQLKVYMQK